VNKTTASLVIRK